MTKNDEILIIYTSWYTDFINEMTGAALERLVSEDCMIKSCLLYTSDAADE